MKRRRAFDVFVLRKTKNANLGSANLLVLSILQQRAPMYFFPQKGRYLAHESDTSSPFSFEPCFFFRCQTHAVSSNRNKHCFFVLGTDVGGLKGAEMPKCPLPALDQEETRLLAGRPGEPFGPINCPSKRSFANVGEAKGRRRDTDAAWLLLVYRRATLFL